MKPTTLREERIGVRLTAQEKARLKKMAEKKYVKLGSYARQAILEKLDRDEAAAGNNVSQRVR